MKGKQADSVMWPRMIANKWLRLKSGGDKFNGDIESETEDDEGKLPLKVPPLLMRGQLETLWTHCIENHEYRLFVGTWNMAGKTPPDDLDLDDWLNTKESCDIYVIGFQEIVPLKAGKVFGPEDRRAADKWDALIRKTLNKTPAQTGIVRSCSAPPSDLPSLHSDWITNDDAALPNLGLEVERALQKLDHLENPPEMVEINASKCRGRQRYKRVASKQMVGIFITIWVKSDLRHHIQDLNVSCVGCGIMGCLGNKGSVSVSMSIHQTTFCFICTHLASGEKEGDELRRNGDVAEILKRTHFPRHSTHLPPLPQTILSHDRIIWFGDLNYRLSLADSKVRSLIDKKDWKTLQQSDQLKMEQNAGRIFQGWREGYMDFAPTYRYAANSDEYCGSHDKPGGKHRVPAWCDRILWYGKGLKQVFYVRGENRFSDHRPVSALFSTQIEALSNQRLEKTLGLSMKLLEAHNLFSQEIEKLPTIHSQEICDGLTNVKTANVDDLLPVLSEMQICQNLGIESMLSPELYAREKEDDLQARFQSVLPQQVLV